MLFLLKYICKFFYAIIVLMSWVIYWCVLYFFFLLGDDGKKEIENFGIQKESENIYTLWCSGRVCVEGMLVELKFLKRQDLVSVISNILRPSSDQIVS